jgi:hypothetical protein
LDVRILAGWCDDFLTSRPLGPLHDVARQAGGALAEAVATGDIGGVLDALLAELAYPLLPTVLLIEDVHWADDATMDVIRYTGRRIQALPAVLALTYRDDEVGPEHPLTGVLGALPPVVTHRVPLRELSRAAVAELTTSASWPGPGSYPQWCSPRSCTSTPGRPTTWAASMMPYALPSRPWSSGREAAT